VIDHFIERQHEEKEEKKKETKEKKKTCQKLLMNTTFFFRFECVHPLCRSGTDKITREIRERERKMTVDRNSTIFSLSFIFHFVLFSTGLSTYRTSFRLSQ
jgi:hypothetical protein